MLVARLNGKPILATRDLARGDDYLCPECLGSMIVRRGLIKVPHFAHRADSGCSYGDGETEDHLRAKLAFYHGLRERGFDVELERRVSLPDGRHRVVDVFVAMGDESLAIELQHSRLSARDLIDRPADYEALGFRQAWIAVDDFGDGCRHWPDKPGIRGVMAMNANTMNSDPLIFNTADDCVYCPGRGDELAVGADDLIPFIWRGDLYFGPFYDPDGLEQRRLRRLAHQMEMQRLAAERRKREQAEARFRALAIRAGLERDYESIIKLCRDRWIMSSNGNWCFPFETERGDTIWITIFEGDDAWKIYVNHKVIRATSCISDDDAIAFVRRNLASHFQRHIEAVAVGRPSAWIMDKPKMIRSEPKRPNKQGAPQWS